MGDCPSPRIRRLRRLPAALAGLAVLAALLCGAVWLALPRTSLYPERITWSRLTLDRQGGALDLSPAGDGRYRLKISSAQVSPALKQAVIAYEDRRFPAHGGVDFLSLLRAAAGYLAGIDAGGASTLTMQVARLRFGLDTRTLPGKAEQMLRAWQLEKYYTKDEILEAWLNLAPFGGNIEGIEAAARIRCGKSAARLTRAESLLLAIQPQSPETRRPERICAPDSREGKARERIYRLMTHEYGWREDGLLRSFHMPMRPAVPHLAPHFSRLARSSSGESVVQTTLDAGRQRRLEDALALHPRLDGDYSLILIHAPTREVRAWIGSPDFGDAARRGQVDGNLARRSPGSLLKPFLFAHALDAGVITPDTLMSDVPSSYQDWTPANYSRVFHGPVRARDALRMSLNMPAVKLMEQVEPGYLHQMLARAGIPLKNPGEYGLTLVLGSAEITPLEMAGLYAALADDGCARSLRFLRSQPSSSGGVPMWSPAARWLVLDMLARPDDGCSWKTGTSQNLRDGWLAAVRGEYVLIIWTGDFRGGRRMRYAGQETALPLLSACLPALELPEAVLERPKEIRDVEICSISGDLPGPACPGRSAGFFIAGVSSLKSCTLHQVFLVDERTGRRVRRPGGRDGLAAKVYEVWPAELAEHFRRVGLPLQSPPPWEDASPASASPPPRILSPVSGRNYLTVDSEGNPARIALRAAAGQGTELHWFLGRRYLGKTLSGETLEIPAEAGSGTLTVADGAGQSSSMHLRVVRPR